MPWISRMRSGATDISCLGVSIPPLISTAVVRGLNPQSANGRCPLALAARRFIRTPRQQHATAPKGDNIEEISGVFATRVPRKVATQRQPRPWEYFRREA